MRQSPMSQQHEPDDCPEDLIPTRKSLLGRLKDWEDNQSWRLFFDTSVNDIYNSPLATTIIPHRHRDG